MALCDHYVNPSRKECVCWKQFLNDVDQGGYWPGWVLTRVGFDQGGYWLGWVLTFNLTWKTMHISLQADMLYTASEQSMIEPKTYIGL